MGVPERVGIYCLYQLTTAPSPIGRKYENGLQGFRFRNTLLPVITNTRKQIT